MKQEHKCLAVFAFIVIILILGIVNNYFCFVNCPEKENKEEKSIEEKTIYKLVDKPFTIRAENSVYDDNISNIEWVDDRLDVNFYFDGLTQDVYSREYVYEYGWIILKWIPDKYGRGMDRMYVMPMANGETEEFYYYDPEVIQNQKEYRDDYETKIFRTKRLGSKHISIVAYEEPDCFPEGCVNYTSIEIIGTNTPELPTKTKSNLLYKLEIKR